MKLKQSLEGHEKELKDTASAIEELEEKHNALTLEEIE